MGGNSSKPQEPPKSVHPPPIKPWRAIVFNNSNYTSLQKEAAEHKPHPKASTTNILLVGPVGSGKSSFVNSVLSEIGNDEFHNRVRYAAMTRVNAGGTVTRHLRCHIHKNIKIFDTAGWDTENHFITTLRFEQIIDGEVPADTKFSDISTNNTTVNGARIHCVVFVMSAHSFDSEDSSLLNALEGFIGVLTNKGGSYIKQVENFHVQCHGGFKLLPRAEN
ncbi:interferon-induced protein 44-like isoform X2 [Polyodon spathula]|uniref:interferon-induced protein 44-like isoform X2 n=1 Tax=Polyodon spathula TaxID=7913 RepID=UPI001B7DBC11|nr:interferon-induced protein 44-like isoform X2 [Polyodon spathula]